MIMEREIWINDKQTECVTKNNKITAVEPDKSLTTAHKNSAVFGDLSSFVRR